METRRVAAVDVTPYVALFFPAGQGTMFDLPLTGVVSRIFEAMAGSGKVVAAICHSPPGLIGATDRTGLLLVHGHILTAFSSDEERAVELDGKMPFLLETRLKEMGKHFEGAPLWGDHVVRDGWLITAQTPQSSTSVAQKVIEA